MLKVKRLSEVYEIKVFTEDGDYFGEVEECIMDIHKIISWKIRATKNSILERTMTNAKGVIIPHKLVKSIGDIMIIAKSGIPNLEEE
ncbi:MAG: PRC-barrel domain-containing protein [Candidatus Woesearchaeota archaeon]